MSGGFIVETCDLTHDYGARRALDGVTLHVRESSLFALLGPNGGGKTTLFRILTTLLRPAAGGASIAGYDVVRQRDEVRRHIGVVFQKPSLDGKLSVLENLTHQGHLYGLLGPELRARCDELLARFGLTDRARERVEKLSGGMQRRVEVAKSLLHRPSLLILDEPTTGLDPGARASLLDYLQELRTRDGVTCLLTTHLMDEAERCDEVAILDRGKLVAVGPPAELKSTIGGDVLTVSAHEPAVLAEKARQRFSVDARLVDGVLHIERDRGHELVPLLIEAFPGEIDSVRVGRPTLDDVFLHLTGHRLWDETRAASAEHLGTGDRSGGPT